MRLWHKVLKRFGRAVEPDLAEEMRTHREMLEDGFRGEGFSPAEARARAARRFGSIAESLETSRAEWSFTGLESIVMDTRYAVRTLLREKTFAVTAVLTLAVGLALTSVAFTLLNAYVLRPFAVSDPDSLYEILWLGKDRLIRVHTWQDYEELRGRKDVLVDALGSRRTIVIDPVRHWSGRLVTGNYFELLGTHIAMGRAIEPRDALSPMGDNVVVISHAAWQSFFNRDPAILGKTIAMRGFKYHVIGVAGPAFTGLDEVPPDFWTPITMLAAFRMEPGVEVVGRLREGVTKAQVESALATQASAHGQDLRATLRPKKTALPFHPMMILVFAPVLLALALVLATCCANLANMLLARGLSRQREIGVRLAIGADRWRLVRQLLTEALLIAMLAGIFGVLLSRLLLGGVRYILISALAPEFSRGLRLHSLEPDHRVLLFALGAAAVAAIGAALLPALQATRPNLVSALRGEIGSSFRSTRVRDALVVLQVVVCAVLLVCGALLHRRAGVFNIQDTGMRQSGVLSVANEDSTLDLATELRAQPDVEAVAVAERAPWFGRLSETSTVPSGRREAVTASVNRVSPDYFRVLGIALKRGRGFTSIESREAAPVAVISEATARAFWPGEEPIGKTIRFVERQQRHLRNIAIPGDIQVIGVAADVTHGWVFDGRDRTCIYLPADQNAKGVERMLVLLRGDEAVTGQRLRRFIADRWPTFSGMITPMRNALEMQVFPFRIAAWIGWTMGLLAMALSVSGMYGVMSYLVSQRSKEIGIRMAIGASPYNVVGMVMRRSMWLACLGVLGGGAAAAVLVKLLLIWSSALGALAWDNVALLLGAGLAGGVAILAALGPSMRAARVDPNKVLRAD